MTVQNRRKAIEKMIERKGAFKEANLLCEEVSATVLYRELIIQCFI